MLIASSVSFALASELSTQAECTTVDVQSQNPEIAAPRDNFDTNYCLADALAYVLGSERNHAISSMDLGFNTRFEQDRKLNRKFYPHGDFRLEELVEFVNDRGYCLESKAISTFSSNRIRNIEQAYVEASRDPRLRNQLFPGTTNRDPIRFETIWPDIQKQISWNCEPRQQLTEKIDFIHRRGQAQLGRKLFSSLDHDKPSIVTLSNSLMFQDGRPDAHSVVLVGRRWNAGSCEYTLRDSGGPHCKNFIGSKLGQPLRCENGNVTISEKKLIEITVQTMEIRSRHGEVPASPINGVPGTLITPWQSATGVR